MSMEKFITTEDTFTVKQNAQMEIINEEGGGVVALEWIQSNGEKFDALMRDPQHDFIEKLANPDTHDAAIGEIKKMLHH